MKSGKRLSDQSNPPAIPYTRNDVGMPSFSARRAFHGMPWLARSPSELSNVAGSSHWSKCIGPDFPSSISRWNWKSSSGSFSPPLPSSDIHPSMLSNPPMPYEPQPMRFMYSGNAPDSISAPSGAKSASAAAFATASALPDAMRHSEPTTATAKPCPPGVANHGRVSVPRLSTPCERRSS